MRTVHLRRAKDAGEKFSMLTSYDVLTAGIFDRSGVDVLLVGDSLGNTCAGLTRARSRSRWRTWSCSRRRWCEACSGRSWWWTSSGSDQESPAQAVRSAARIMKDTGARRQAEGGEAVAEHIAGGPRGIPATGHVGFTPQSAATRWAASASRAAVGPLNSCSGTPAPSRTPAASPC
ncbi:3-methyl-2-oxobutanoate hydroxymethyltransferase [Kocuria rhizophila]|nr:3-methyl-2-oxobutanoate hydroxymethyltransferase [Kocuria rhizophila]